MKKTIAVLPGDGVGPEVTAAAVIVLEKVAGKFRHNFIFKEGLIGSVAIEKACNPLPDETLNFCKKSDAILFGAIGDPKYDLNPGAKIRPEQGLLNLRQSLHLYANLRPVKVFPELMESSPIKEDRIRNVDLLVVRELTSGIYFGQPRKRIDNGNVAIDTSVYSKNEIIRVTKMACNLAMKRRKKITSVDKANVLETSRLWRETVTEISRKFPQVILTHMFVDNAAMQLIKRPAEFDVILTENMFGDILSDEASVITGSIGLLPSASIGEKYALYEPIHGAFNRAAGRNIANPIGTILSAVMMLRISFGLENEAKAVEEAINNVLSSGFRTRDIATEKTEKNYILGTKEFTEKVVEAI
jgi:3-isopropylmalate dehydrogenase